jgi:hypothetical protein
MVAKKHKEHKRGDEARWSEEVANGGAVWRGCRERVKWEDGVRVDPSESK